MHNSHNCVCFLLVIPEFFLFFFLKEETLVAVFFIFKPHVDYIATPNKGLNLV